MTGSNSDPIMFYNGTGSILEKIGRHHIIFPNAPNLHVNKTKNLKDTIASLTNGYGQKYGLIILTVIES